MKLKLSLLFFIILVLSLTSVYALPAVTIELPEVETIVINNQTIEIAVGNETNRFQKSLRYK